MGLQIKIDHIYIWLLLVSRSLLPVISYNNKKIYARGYAANVYNFTPSVSALCLIIVILSI